MKRRYDVAKKLLRLAKAHERRAVSQAATAGRVHRDAEEAVEAVDTDAARAEKKVLETPAVGGLTLAELFSGREAAEISRDACEREAARAALSLAEKRAELQARRRRMKTRESVRDHARRLYRLDVAKREQRELEELSAARFVMARGAS